MCVIYRKKKKTIYILQKYASVLKWKIIIQTAVEETSEINHHNVPYTKQVA